MCLYVEVMVQGAVFGMRTIELPGDKLDLWKPEASKMLSRWATAGLAIIEAFHSVSTYWRYNVLMWKYQVTQINQSVPVTFMSNNQYLAQDVVVFLSETATCGEIGGKSPEFRLS